ncbi:MAG: RNA methyltransferase, partial [Lachnospiraceae bacterium]|nr:RNA methyltransferase [Lachnospiraceae bacterium]
MDKKDENIQLENSNIVEGKNSVLEAIRAGATIDKLYVAEGKRSEHIQAIVEKAKKNNVLIQFVSNERLLRMSPTGKPGGVIANLAAHDYSTVEDILEFAESKNESPFIIILDEIEDPHNLGAIIRTANLVGAHGVIIPKRRAATLTSTVVKASA